MAGKGGGAWKVAYADFVTAMMAFFLVMWITCQDKKIKEAVAHYFVDPMGYFSIGSSNTPSGSGAIFGGLGAGSVPSGSTAPMGRGRMSHTDDGTLGAVTRTVSDWIATDEARYAQWQEEAKATKRAAEKSYDVLVEKSDAHEVAVDELAEKLRKQFAKQAPQGEGVYSDLLQESLEVVQWREIAQDLLGE